MDQLNEIKKIIRAEKSDVFDVLAYIAYKYDPVTRKEQVDQHKNVIPFNKLQLVSQTKALP